jgi:hypothetical protein
MFVEKFNHFKLLLMGVLFQGPFMDATPEKSTREAK